MADAPDLESLIHSTEWTPEQQLQELERRLDIFDNFLKKSAPASPFTPRPDDVICAVPIKCGTTWLMHICHQIRMQGVEPDFEDQSKVVCWIEWNKLFHGVDPNDVIQPVKPRLFVTRFTDYDKVPKSKRIIYLFRDQMDALYSLYLVKDSSLMLRGRVTLSLFADYTIKSGVIRKRFEDLVVWWEKRHQENILLLFYDDLKENHAGSVRRIAKFMGVDCDEDVIARVVHTTSHAEMSKHSYKFENSTFTLAQAKQIGEEPIFGTDEYIGRVRKSGGRSGDGKILPPDIQEQINQLWREIVTAKLGFQNLQEMREVRLKELQKQ